MGIRAGAAERDVTPPVGYEITHWERLSQGVRDPLFVRCLYLTDDQGEQVAILCTDFIGASIETCDQLRDEIARKTGIHNTLFNCSHSHSSVWLGPRGRPDNPSDLDGAWNQQTHDAILATVQEAKAKAQPVTLAASRAPAQVGFNRRLVNKENGHVYMAVNREGPVVPWVNVLTARSPQDGKLVAVLFEHAAHPVIVPNGSALISADYPGAAVKRVREKLGEEVITLFGQGCGGNINGFPLRTTHENAEAAGQKLGDAVLAAIKTEEPIEADDLKVKSAQSFLPTHQLPSEELWEKLAEKHTEEPHRMKQLHGIKQLLDRGAQPLPRRFDAYAVMLGDEWCLVTMPYEMFCQYELWVDENAPFEHNMTFGYTNGGRDYIAVDEAWALDEKAGYEAAALPSWAGYGTRTTHFNPPAVGSEAIIKQTVRSLWPEGEANSATDKPAE